MSFLKMSFLFLVIVGHQVKAEDLRVVDLIANDQVICGVTVAGRVQCFGNSHLGGDGYLLKYSSWEFPEFKGVVENFNVRQFLPLARNQDNSRAFIAYRTGELVYAAKGRVVLKFPNTVVAKNLQEQVSRNCLIYRGRLKCGVMTRAAKRLGIKYEEYPSNPFSADPQNFSPTCNPSQGGRPCQILEEDIEGAADLGPAEQLTESWTGYLCKLSQAQVTCFRRDFGDYDFTQWTEVDWGRDKNPWVKNERELSGVKYLRSTLSITCATYFNGDTRCWDEYYDPRKQYDLKILGLSRGDGASIPAVPYNLGRCFLDLSGRPRCSRYLSSEPVSDLDFAIQIGETTGILPGLIPSNQIFGATHIVSGGEGAFCVLLEGVMRCFGDGVAYRQDQLKWNQNSGVMYDFIPARWPFIE